MPRLDLAAVEQTNRTGYPEPYASEMSGRRYRRIGDFAGLEDFGASHVVLKPGAWTSQRHWHAEEDELLVMLSGRAVLVEDDGEQELSAGDIVAWPAGSRNGHHLINRTSEPCTFLCVSAGKNKGGGYSDIDMLFTADDRYVHKDGTPY